MNAQTPIASAKILDRKADFCKLISGLATGYPELEKGHPDLHLVMDYNNRDEPRIALLVIERCADQNLYHVCGRDELRRLLAENKIGCELFNEGAVMLDRIDRLHDIIQLQIKDPWLNDVLLEFVPHGRFGPDIHSIIPYMQHIQPGRGFESASGVTTNRRIAAAPYRSVDAGQGGALTLDQLCT